MCVCVCVCVCVGLRRFFKQKSINFYDGLWSLIRTAKTDLFSYVFYRVKGQIMTLSSYK